MEYGIPPNLGGHISGVDILLNKKTKQINYHQDVYLKNFNHLDIKYNLIDYIHLELVDGSVNSSDIFDIFESQDYHLALSKETHNFQISLSSNKTVFGLQYNSKDFLPHGFYLTPDTKESYFSIYGFNTMNFSDLDFLKLATIL